MEDAIDDEEFGTLARRGACWTLVFTRHLPYPLDRVWRAVIEPEDRSSWFPQKIVGERRAGASLRFESSTGDAFEGTMRVYEPPRVVELVWGDDTLRIELQRDRDGTLLTLTDTFDELGKAARDAAGWHECLDRLSADLAERGIPPWGDRWRVVHPQYVDRLGPAASTIGPPEGWQEAVTDQG
jgi:uncharacterized protein YndB with AHSA1/START domain